MNIMRKFLSLIIVFVFAVSVFATHGAELPQTVFGYNVKVTNNWVWYNPDRPKLEVVVKNNTGEQSRVEVKIDVLTDTRKSVYTLSQDVSLMNGDSTLISFSFDVTEPGFYRCHLTEIGENSVQIKRFNIGYEPQMICSLPDAQPDLKEFWDKAKSDLAAVDPQFKLELIPERSSKMRSTYKVTMRSLDNELISGYYIVPVKKGKYPTIITFMGYGSKPWDVNPDWNTDFIEFILSVRGQGLNQPENKYGDWITYGLESKEKFYYRGAFMDLVRAVDFIYSREEARKDAIFAEGGSQGGAFTMAVCALDKRITAAAPYINFLSDYKDYFGIVHWPAEPVLKKQAELGISDKQLYEMLSYFDIKNLAPWISCPIMQGVGLQDEVCPPHTVFAGYNQLTSDKRYYIYSECGHAVGEDWWPKRMEFFRSFIK